MSSTRSVASASLRLNLRLLVCAGLLAGAASCPGYAAQWSSMPSARILVHASFHPAGDPHPKHPDPQPEQHPGYLGVLLRNVEGELPVHILREKHGAMIVTVDRDAPACAAGLRAGDVITEMNGQRVNDVEELRHMLHNTVPGNSITLRYTRNGEQGVVSLVLADEAVMAQLAWQHLNGAEQQASPDNQQPGIGNSPGANGFLPSSGHTATPKFFPNFPLGATYTGAEVDPLSAQLAEFFGVRNGAGLLVRSIDDDSPAAAAGLKAGDVILRINNTVVVSRVDWMKQLHASRGEIVQLAVMRNRRELTFSMLAGKDKEKKKD